MRKRVLRDQTFAAIRLIECVETGTAILWVDETTLSTSAKSARRKAELRDIRCKDVRSGDSSTLAEKYPVIGVAPVVLSVQSPDRLKIQVAADRLMLERRVTREKCGRDGQQGRMQEEVASEDRLVVEESVIA